MAVKGENPRGKQIGKALINRYPGENVYEIHSKMELLWHTQWQTYSLLKENGQAATAPPMYPAG